MDTKLDNYEYQRRRRQQMRRREAMRKKRKKKMRIRRIKNICRFVTAVVLLAIVGMVTIEYIRKDQEKDSSFIAKETMDVAASINTVTVKQRTYPQIAANYKEIQVDTVKSPYVALLDVDNNQLIAGRNSDQKIYPASMTKVMTLIVAVEQIQDVNRTYTMSASMIADLVAQQASRAGFEAGETVTFTDLLYGLILPSGADSAVALSEMVAGTEEAFANKMNQKCQELGLKNTHFMNASGLFDENQYTTPVEMAMIMQYAMENEQCAKVLSTYQYTTTPSIQHPEGIKLTSTMFSRMYGNEVEGVLITAGKTGYTDEAKSCLVSYAQKDGRHYVAVTAAADYKWHVIFDDFEIYRNYLP